MDLSGGQLTQAGVGHAVVSGWVNAVYPARGEARGWFSLSAPGSFSVRNGRLVLAAQGLALEVIVVHRAVGEGAVGEGTVGERRGPARWHFLAACDAAAVQARLRPNAGLTRSEQEIITFELEVLGRGAPSG